MDTKMAEIQATLDIYSPDVLALAETHHTETPTEIIGYNFIGSATDSHHKSGTGLFLKESS